MKNKADFKPVTQDDIEALKVVLSQYDLGLPTFVLLDRVFQQAEAYHDLEY